MPFVTVVVQITYSASTLPRKIWSIKEIAGGSNHLECGDRIRAEGDSMLGVKVLIVGGFDAVRDFFFEDSNSIRIQNQ
jgi:hypothetical protein